MPARITICLYADSGGGKTYQIGELAEDLYAKTGKVTRLFSSDEGGWLTIAHLVKKGIIQPTALAHLADPFDWLDHASKGQVLAGSQWRDQTPDEATKVGLYAFEGMTSIAETLLLNLAEMASRGQNLGGGANISFRQGTTAIGGNNQAHYGIIQGVTKKACSTSFRLSNPLAGKDKEVEPIVLWTASARRAADGDTNSPILGPQAAGKALTSEIPRWFNYLFHLVTIPADEMTKQKEEFRLYFGAHTDQTAPGSKALGNARLPKGAEPLPPYLSPASLPAALELLATKEAQADKALDQRLGKAKITLVKGPAGA